MQRTVIILGFILIFASSFSVIAQDNTLNITWVESDECTLFNLLTNDYTQATINVRCVASTQWFDAIFIDIAGQSGADLFVMDTQFFGASTERNALLDLTDWYATNFDNGLIPSRVLDIHRTDESELVAMPLQADVRLLAYRADLYQAMKNKENKPEPGKDIRNILVEDSDFVPAYSLPYTIDPGTNDPIFLVK